MNQKLIIKTCPNCGSKEIQRVVQDITREYKGKAYTVPSVEYYDCPNCHENIFDREAVLKIEAFSPAYHKQHTLKEKQALPIVANQ